MSKIDVFFGLNRRSGEQFVKNVGNISGLFTLSISALVEYELSEGNIKNEVCGQGYLDRVINKTAISALEYQKTIVWLDYEFLSREEVYREFSDRANLIFVDLPRGMMDSKVSEIAFDERRKKCLEIASRVIEVKQIDNKELVRKVAESL